MKIQLALLLFFLVSLNHPNFAQQSNPDLAKVIESMQQLLATYDTCHYKAEMWFKEFGGDSFEVRKFLINYKTNISNPLYHYDFQMDEYFGDTAVWSLLALNKSTYSIFTGSTKAIGESSLPEVIDEGSYQEAMRSYFIWPEIFRPFLNADPAEISLVDSIDAYTLQMQTTTLFIRKLVLDKTSYLPLSWEMIGKSKDFDLEQVEQFYFHYDDKINSLSENAFSPDFYISSGYEYKFYGSESSSDEDENVLFPTLTEEQQKLLIEYSFISAKGDTSRIIESSANYIVLDFWYASCAPCQEALPELNRLATNYANKDLQVIGLNCYDKGNRVNLEKKLREKIINFDLWFGSRELLEALKIRAFPSYFIVTPDRKIQTIYGGVDEARQKLEGLLKK